LNIFAQNFKFGTETKNDLPKTVLPSDFTSEKIQYGGHPGDWVSCTLLNHEAICVTQLK